MLGSRFAQKITKRLANVAGESITEALVGMLIVVLAFVMLCGAVVTAARVNTTIRPENTSFVENPLADTSTNANVTIIYEDGTSNTVSASGYVSSQGGYVYYETN